MNDSHATASPAATPADLVRRIAAGDPGAETQLVERYGRGIELLLLRHTRRGEGLPDAEDLYQETFAVALQKLRQGELREANKLPGFLSGIARNLAIEVYRKRARRKTDADSEVVHQQAAVAPSQLGVVLQREQGNLMRRLLGELPTPRDREILFRFYLGEEDKDAIAADLGLDGGQFNRVLHRARGRFKELLRPYLAGLLEVARFLPLLWWIGS